MSSKPRIGMRWLQRVASQRGQRNRRGGRYKRFPPVKFISNWVVDRLIDEIIEEASGRVVHVTMHMVETATDRINNQESGALYEKQTALSTIKAPS